MTKTSIPRTPLDSASLAAAVGQLIELATEFECINVAQPDDVDAEIFQELFDLEETRTALEKVVGILRKQAQRRRDGVKLVRAARFAHALLVLPARAELPKDFAEQFSRLAFEFGLEISEAQREEIVNEVPRLARARDDGRASRIVKILTGIQYSDRHLRYLFNVLDAEGDDSGTIQTSVTRAKIKYPGQLVVSWYEGTGATAHVKYILSVVGAGTPEAAQAAFSGWNETLLRQWDQRSTDAR